MQHVLIYGAGGHGKEIAWITERTNQFKVTGFFDDFFDQATFSGYPVFKNLSDIPKHNFFVIAIGDPAIRKKVIIRLIDNGFGNFPSIIDPSAIVSTDAIIEEGVVVFPRCVISTNVVLHAFCNINMGSTISHRSVIGEYTNICPNTTICGDVTIGNEVFIGAGATINDHILVGEKAYLGSGSVAIHNIIENSLYVGVPAKFKKTLGGQK